MSDNPLIVVNFKVYAEVCGEKGIALAKTCEKVSEETGSQVIACPQMTDLGYTCATVATPVWSQNADDVALGGNTGHSTVEALASAGAKGTLLNHSECRKKISDISSLVKRCDKKGLDTCICTNDISVSCACAALVPTYVAVEPPELIGGDISVTTADPGIVSSTVEAVEAVNSSVNVLCGAGVKTAEDVKKAWELGAKGVLLASGVVKAKDPYQILSGLASAV